MNVRPATRPTLRHTPLLTAAFVIAAACGRSSIKKDDASTGDGAVGDSPGADTAPGPCPLSPPSAGASCTSDGLPCEYGADPNPRCHQMARCSNGAWAIFDGALPGCPSAKAASCPATVDVARNTPCTEEDTWCAWSSGAVCQCTKCRQGPVGDVCADAATWHCSAAPLECPAGIPRSGMAECSGQHYCDYGCEYGGVYRCSAGLWQSDYENCPMSTRAAKEDIHYLSADEVDRLARNTEAMRLATYRYRSAALGTPGRHLGFIVEDNPDVPAVSSSRQTVDLYGFASMLLATSQAQARRLELLEGEVARLRKAGRRFSPPTLRSR